MRKLSLVMFLALLLSCAVFPWQAVRSPDTGTDTMSNTFPGPPIIPKIQPDKAKADMEEFTRLSQALPAQVHQALQGTVSKDLVPNLKRIEKLSKQLRSDLAL